MRNITLFCLMILMAWGCNTNPDDASATSSSSHENPSIYGFDVEGSDAEAVAIADQCMRAMGGYQNWENTRFLHWTFIDGDRTWTWDRYTGDVRLDSKKRGLALLMNINTKQGKVMKNGTEITDTEDLARFMTQGEAMWINDSYWLVMPFKLKDSGVTLKYVGERENGEGKPSEVIAMTFDGVGNTPENKYLVYIDQTTRLVNQWDYFVNFSDAEPRFFSAWDNYEKYGNILLSSGRGTRNLTNIKVLEALPEGTFTEFDQPAI